MPSATAVAALPVYRVAVVQSESESLHNPTLDVTGALGDRERWQYRLFTDRTFSALLRAHAEFDCIVIGYNAIHRNDRIARLLAETKLAAGVLLLHQLSVPDAMSIGPSLALSMGALETPGTGARVARERDGELEILLNWPVAVDVAALAARAVCALEPAPDTSWRPVLEMGDGRPVLMRSSLATRPHVVATSLLLEPGRAQHRALLENLIVYCAAGPPGTVVLPTGAPWAGTLVRKLRLRRVNAVELDAAGAALDCRRWPLRAVSDLIVPRDHPPIAAQDTWLAAGGRLTTVDPATGELHVRYRARDVRWVARRWSSWLGSGAGEARRTSVMATRAYVRTLSTLEQALGADLERFGLAPLAQHVEEVRALAGRRLKEGDSLEETVSATAALLELVDDVPGALEPARLERVRAWLAAAAAGAGAEDRLEIARVLGDAEVLDGAVADLRRPLSASTISRLRLAAIACARLDLAVVVDGEDRDAIAAEVVSSVLAAAEYLSSLVAFRAALSEHPDLPADALFVGDGVLADSAIATLTKHGTLAGEGDAGPGATPEEVCAEALALISYLGLDDVATTELVKAETVPPPPFVDDLLREGQRIRRANTEARAEAARAAGEAAALGRDLRLACNLLGAVVVVLAALAAAGALALSTIVLEGVPELLADFAAPLSAGPLVLATLGVLLARRGLCPQWLITWGGALQDGAKSLKEFAFGSLGRASRRGPDGDGPGADDDGAPGPARISSVDDEAKP